MKAISYGGQGTGRRRDIRQPTAAAANMANVERCADHDRPSCSPTAEVGVFSHAEAERYRSRASGRNLIVSRRPLKRSYSQRLRRQPRTSGRSPSLTRFEGHLGGRPPRVDVGEGHLHRTDGSGTGERFASGGVAFRRPITADDEVCRPATSRAVLRRALASTPVCAPRQAMPIPTGRRTPAAHRPSACSGGSDRRRRTRRARRHRAERSRRGRARAAATAAPRGIGRSFRVPHDAARDRRRAAMVLVKCPRLHRTRLAAAGVSGRLQLVELLVARNPDPNGRLPYLLRVPLGEAPAGRRGVLAFAAHAEADQAGGSAPDRPRAGDRGARDRGRRARALSVRVRRAADPHGRSRPLGGRLRRLRGGTGGRGGRAQVA